MRFSSSIVLLFLGLSTLSAGLPKICPHLRNTNRGGCELYVKGFDVTGVLTEVELGPMDDVCDCIQACLDNPTTCASYVWKVTETQMHPTKQKNCTLYSDFNFPSDVTVEFDLNSPNNKNIIPEEIIANDNNPHVGGPVPQAFLDPDTMKKPDNDAASG